MKSFLVSAILAVASITTSEATIFNITWKTNPNQNTLSALPGDTLIFNFAANAHNVFQFKTAQDLNDCNFNNGQMLSTTSPFKFTVTGTDELFFGCKVPNHCQNGKQKLSVKPAKVISVAWKNPVAEQQVTASPGDRLNFQFGAAHNLYSFATEDDMKQCNFNNAKVVSDTGPFNVTVGGAAPKMFFACKKPGHCTGGQMLTVTVAAAAAGGAAPTATAPTGGAGNTTTPTDAGTAPAPVGGQTVQVKWAKTLETNTVTAAPGDSINFEFAGTSHDVYMFMTKADFEACDFAKGMMLASSGPFMYPIPATTTTPMWFSCSKTGHCTGGQKLTVKMAAAGGAGAGGADTPTNATAPTTSGVSNVMGHSALTFTLVVAGFLFSL